MITSANKGQTHKERLENLYQGQAKDYDDFRKRFLHGRDEMYKSIAEACSGGVWVDMGGGTGANLESLGEKIHNFSKVYIVDLCQPLLDVAEKRVQKHGWRNVEIMLGDATKVSLPTKVDVVTFSYSLTMIPEWFLAIDKAQDLLNVNGYIGVVDFLLAHKHAKIKQSWFKRTFWQSWFYFDNVFLNQDHIPYLSNKFLCLGQQQSVGKVPYLPIKAPFYTFIGKKRNEIC